MRFEIVYDNFSIVLGSTSAEFETAPDVGIQFVIIESDSGSVRIHKAADEYEFCGVNKIGSWTGKAMYEKIKSALPYISHLI